MSLFTDLILRGTRASQPAASSVSTGTLYFVTDEAKIERSSGSAWETYSGMQAATSQVPIFRKTFSYFPSGQESNAVMKGIGIENGSEAASSRSMQTGTSATFWGERLNTPNTNGANVSLVGVSMVYTLSDPTAYFRIKTGTDITNIRFFLGLFSASISASNADAFNLHYVSFRYSTVVPDGGWVGVCCNGTSANAQTTATVGAIAANTEYWLRIRVASDGTAVFFSISTDGVTYGTEQTLSVNLPSTSTRLLFDVHQINQAASARFFIWNALYCELPAGA